MGAWRRRTVLGVVPGVTAGIAGCSTLSQTDNSGADAEANETESTDDSAELDWEAVDPSRSASFGGSPRNHGYAGPVSLPEDDPEQRWSTAVDGDAANGLAVVDGVVFVADDEGTVTALDATTGTIDWERSIDDGRGQCPCVIDGKVVVGTGDDRLVALNKEAGDVEWEQELAGPVSGPTGASGYVYVGTDDLGIEIVDEGEYRFYAVDATSGAIDWEQSIDLPAVEYPAVSHETVYVGCEWTADGRLVALDRETGEPRWEKTGQRMQSPVVVSDAVFAPSLDVTVYTPSGDRSRVYSTSGHVVWTPAVTQDADFTAGTGGTLVASSRTESGPDWSVDLDARPGSGPTVTDTLVVIVGPETELLAFDSETGDKQWSRELDGEFAGKPATANDAVFVGTSSGQVYAFE